MYYLSFPFVLSDRLTILSFILSSHNTNNNVICVRSPHSITPEEAASQYQGLHLTELMQPIKMGKVTHDSTAEQCRLVGVAAATVNMQMWRTDKGDIGKTWSARKKAGTSQMWTADIPRGAIVLISPAFAGKSKRFNAATLKALSENSKVPGVYQAGPGGGRGGKAWVHHNDMGAAPLPAAAAPPPASAAAAPVPAAAAPPPASAAAAPVPAAAAPSVRSSRRRRTAVGPFTGALPPSVAAAAIADAAADALAAEAVSEDAVDARV
jgi:hypothetical protein